MKFQDNYNMKIENMEYLVWRYYMSCWTNRRICSANGGFPLAVKRELYYEQTNRGV